MAFEVWTCPVCGSSLVGRIAANQYYCWDCCVEFAVKGDRITVYEVDSEGMLVDITDSGSAYSEQAQLQGDGSP